MNARAHPHIAAIHDVETCGAVDHLVLELVEDDTLRGPVAVATALDYGRQVADALAAAHAKGIVHRDLKPSNVKVTPEGAIKVLDFGLARGSRDVEPLAASSGSVAAGQSGSAPGGIVGSPAYMSPERARGDRVDARTDVWAFGCLLFERLGTRPDRKRHVIFDAGHMMFPRGPMTDEVLRRLDRVLGPVDRP